MSKLMVVIMASVLVLSGCEKSDDRLLSSIQENRIHELEVAMIENGCQMQGECNYPEKMEPITFYRKCVWNHHEDENIIDSVMDVIKGDE